MTLRTFAVDLDDGLYQAAAQRAQAEGRSLEDVVAEMLITYAGGQPKQGLSSYTVKRGDTLGRIAGQVYGDPHQYPLIQRANNLSDPGRIWIGQVLVIPALPGAAPQPAQPATPAPAPAPAPSTPAPTPVPVPKPEPKPEPPAAPKIDPCAQIPGESYGSIPIVGPPTDRPAAKHGDINLALRGYSPTKSTKGLIDMSGPTDHRAPQLMGLFADNRIPTISGVYQVHHWDWASNSKGGAVTDFEVTLAGMQVEPGETIHVPKADYDIGQGYAVMVLYADKERITLKYTGEDSVAGGYAIHVEDVCVEPSLLEMYEQLNAAGRSKLPALRAGQAFGRARGNEIKASIRDTGRFMDPRVRKDWWHG